MRYTRGEVERVARTSFQLAQKRRKLVTSVDKANVLEVSQLWRDTVIEVSKEFPDVKLEHQFVDAMSMHLMKRPRDFDVVVVENTFGDILTDEASVITGSLGMLPSGTVGGKINLYEPAHGSAPKHANKNIANPLATILTGAMLLRHSFGLDAEADAIVKAVRKVLEAGFRTQDLARTNPEGLTVLGTREMGAKVRETVKTLLVNA
jgi:3-isopropylmalate dehydrogenase